MDYADLSDLLELVKTNNYIIHSAAREKIIKFVRMWGVDMELICECEERWKIAQRVNSHKKFIFYIIKFKK